MTDSTHADSMTALMVGELRTALISSGLFEGINLHVTQQDDGAQIHIMAVSTSSLGVLLATLTDRLAGRCRALPSDAGLHITVLLDDQLTDDELRANTRANGLRVPPLGGSYRFTPPRCGWVVGFGAIPTPDVPAAVDALVTALAAATRR